MNTSNSSSSQSWFQYWKISSSLWETKVMSFRHTAPVIVPIYWGFHERDGSTDFGSNRADTDLLQIYNLCQQHGLSLYFVIPKSPVPFMSNGGVPAAHAKVQALSQFGISRFTFDSDHNICRIYSFYDPRIFSAYTQFLKRLHFYLTSNGLSENIFMGEFFSPVGHEHVSFLDDKSIAFQKGFERYKNALPQLKESDEEMSRNYQLEISSLYESIIREQFPGLIQGLISFSALGSWVTDNLLSSCTSWKQEQAYMEMLSENWNSGYMPTLTYESKDKDSSNLDEVLKLSWTSINIDLINGKSYYDDDSGFSFHPLSFFEILTSNINHNFLTFLRDDYQGTFQYAKKLDAVDIAYSQTFVSLRNALTEKEFYSIIKRFLNGQKVILNLSGLSHKVKEIYERFKIENDLQVETVNYFSRIEKMSLGDGTLISYYDHELDQAPTLKKHVFWEKMIQFIGTNHLKVNHDKDVHYFWELRSPNSYELSYEQIRRLSIFNSSDMNRTVQINTHKSFAFIKTTNDHLCEISTSPVGIEIRLKAKGRVQLNFGYFE